MKRLLAFLFVLLNVLSLLVSCADDTEYASIEYRENGLYFVLPNTMRRKTSDYYEFCFTNYNIGVVFNAKKLTAEVLGQEGIAAGITADEYVDIIVEKNNFDKKSIYYTYFETLGQYNFRYTYVNQDASETFYYVTVIGGAENLWCIEMCCDNEVSVQHLPMFEKWRKSIGIY